MLKIEKKTTPDLVSTRRKRTLDTHMGSMKAVSIAKWSCGELFSSVHASWNGAKTKGSSSWSSTKPRYSFRTGTCVHEGSKSEKKPPTAS